VTDAVLDEVKAWQSRPLTLSTPCLFDALVVKMRSEGRVENRAVYVAIGVTLEGCKEVLGLWTSANEGAKVLATGADGVNQSRRQGHLHRLC